MNAPCSKALTTLEMGREKITLSWCTVGELGFTEEPTTIQLLGRLKELDAICSEAIAYQLREQMMERFQEEGKYIPIFCYAVEQPNANPPSDGLWVSRSGPHPFLGGKMNSQLIFNAEAHYSLQLPIICGLQKEEIKVGPWQAPRWLSFFTSCGRQKKSDGSPGLKYSA